MRVKEHENLYRTLTKNGHDFPAHCGGHQTCAKCKVKVLKGKIELDAREEKLLRQEEIEENVRLACFHTDLKEEVEIEICKPKTMEILGSRQQRYAIKHLEEGVGVAIDVGTTTIVMIWIDLSSGEVIKEAKFKNPQTIYGSDVISRIQACQEHGVDLLAQRIQQAIEEFLQFDRERIRRIYLCGNPTMEHIVLGIDPHSISQYPYTCAFHDLQIFPANHVFKSLNCPCVVFANISAFVGGDIVADLYNLVEKKEKFLLIDLGTNGEIVLSDGNRLYCTAAAAGPAFEGGQMLWGQASLAGAIHSIHLSEEGVVFKTIGEQEPTGICGSGYIEAFAQMLRHHKMDETGWMKEDLSIVAPIVITQADLRQFQLSKSAIRTAIDLLLDRAQMDLEEVEQVYMAGGFSCSSQPSDLIDLKIIPEEWAEKIVLIGNSAIEGVIQAMLEEDHEKIRAIQRKAIPLDLNRHPAFNQKFMENMWF